MIANIVYSLLMGFLFGLFYDIDTLLVNSFLNKAVKFIIDFLMMCLFGTIYFIFMLSFNDGIFRGVYFLSTIIGFIIYIHTFFKVFSKIRNAVSYYFRKLFSHINVRLPKINNFKKVLQIHK